MAEQTTRIVIRRAQLQGLRAEISFQMHRAAADAQLSTRDGEHDAAAAQHEEANMLQDLLQRVDRLLDTARDYRPPRR